MIRALFLLAALAGCSQMEKPTTPTSPAESHTMALESTTVDGLAEGTSLTLDEAAANILGSGKYETATFALG